MYKLHMVTVSYTLSELYIGTKYDPSFIVLRHKYPYHLFLILNFNFCPLFTSLGEIHNILKKPIYFIYQTYFIYVS